MTDTAIHVENLSKLDRIGAKQESYRTLRDTITNTFTAPFRRLKNSAIRNPRPVKCGANFTGP
jgi:hypothetical protein